MGIKHATTKVPGDRLFAVADWNAEHVPTGLVSWDPAYAGGKISFTQPAIPTAHGLLIENNSAAATYRGIQCNNNSTGYGAVFHNVSTGYGLMVDTLSTGIAAWFGNAGTAGSKALVVQNYSSGLGLQVVGTAASTGKMIDISNSGTGDDIESTTGKWKITKEGTLSFYPTGSTRWINLSRPNPAGLYSGDIAWQTAGVDRWILRLDNDPETGGNAGSTLDLMRRNDAGGSLGSVIIAKRQTGDLYLCSGGGYVGIGITTPTATMDLLGSTGYNQLRLRTSYTPTGTGDTNGNTGDLAWDANYIYVKTAAGWKRAALSTF